MKKIFIFILSCMLFSCEDLLIEKPKSIAVETFYNTPDEMESALAAIYAPLKQYDCMGARYIAAQVTSTDYSKGRGSNFPISEFQGLDATNINRVKAMWSYFYKSIRNANLVIANAPNGRDLTPDEIAKFVGEAKFLRGFVYFIMVRNWGGLPLRTEANMTDHDVKRNSAEEVYQLIIQDLLNAEKSLPDNAPYSGKPTKWAAKTVLADVYFYLGQYTEARDKAHEVIQSNKYSLVPVAEAEDFENIFGPEIITTPEEIFYLKYSRESSTYGWNFVYVNNHPASEYQPFGGNYLVYSDETFPFISNWDKNDLRYIHQWYKRNIGFGTTTILNRKFADKYATSSSGAGNDYPLYRYADLLLLYAEADCRIAGAPTADAIEKLNMIRRRAYGKNSLASSEKDFKLADYNKESFIDLVLQERGYETCWEGKRWLDLIRIGKVKEFIKTAHGKDIADVQLLWPIPVSEMEYNKLLTPDDQNPGY